jgi:uncharacterized protein
MLRTLFWNEDERRLRFGWRIAGFTLLSLLLSAILTVALAPQYVMSMDDVLSPSVFLRVSIGTLIAYGLATGATARLLDRRPIREYGLRLGAAWWRDLGFGLVLGAALMGAIFAVEWAAGWLTITGTAQPGDGGPFLPAFLAVVGAFICIGVYEELAFRGVYLTNLAEWLSGFGALSDRQGLLGANIITASLFGLLHALNPNASVISTLNIVIAGATILSLGRLLTGELAIPIGVHITWNLFQAAVFGFPVSGLDLDTTVIAIEQGGPAWLTGGAFGPEAGVLGLLAVLIGSGLTVLWIRRTGSGAQKDLWG